jgi:hypothetical protein
VRPGDVFRVDADTVTYKVKSVESDTSLTLERAYAGTPGSGLGYKIFQALEGVPGDSSGNREPQGPAGADATVSLSTTIVVTPDTNPDVSNGGTPGAADFTFSLPRAPTFAVGTVTSVAAGVDPTVTDVGTNGDIVLNFQLEQGETGPQGIQGIPGESGLPMNATTRTAAFTATAGEAYKIDTSGGAFDITMPASPSEGDRVGFVDVGLAFGTTPPTLLNNGSLFGGNAAGTDVSINKTRAYYEFAWTSDIGWVVSKLTSGA